MRRINSVLEKREPTTITQISEEWFLIIRETERTMNAEESPFLPKCNHTRFWSKKILDLTELTEEPLLFAGPYRNPRKDPVGQKPTKQTIKKPE